MLAWLQQAKSLIYLKICWNFAVPAAEEVLNVVVVAVTDTSELAIGMMANRLDVVAAIVAGGLAVSEVNKLNVVNWQELCAVELLLWLS